MTTIFLREAAPAIPDHVTPTVPVLARLCRSIMERPPAVSHEPLCIEPGIYRDAESEMKKLMKARGYPTIGCADLPYDNFLLFGVPVCCVKDSDG